MSLLRLASASLLPIPRAGYDFFTGVVRRVFGEPAAPVAAGLPRLEGGGRVAGSKGVYWQSPCAAGWASLWFVRFVSVKGLCNAVCSRYCYSLAAPLGRPRPPAGPAARARHRLPPPCTPPLVRLSHSASCRRRRPQAPSSRAPCAAWRMSCGRTIWGSLRWMPLWRPTLLRWGLAEGGIFGWDWYVWGLTDSASTLQRRHEMVANV